MGAPPPNPPLCAVQSSCEEFSSCSEFESDSRPKPVSPLESDAAAARSTDELLAVLAKREPVPPPPSKEALAPPPNAAAPPPHDPLSNREGTGRGNQEKRIGHLPPGLFVGIPVCWIPRTAEGQGRKGLHL